MLKLVIAIMFSKKCHALSDLVPFVEFEKREKHS